MDTVQVGDVHAWPHSGWWVVTDINHDHKTCTLICIRLDGCELDEGHCRPCYHYALSLVAQRPRVLEKDMSAQDRVNHAMAMFGICPLKEPTE